MGRIPLVTVLARNMQLEIFDEALEMLRVPLVTILARETLLRFFLDVANDASNDIGVRNAIELFPRRCCECR